MDIKTVKLVASDSYLAPYYAATNYIEDTRSINPTPKTVETQTVKYDFKQNTLIDVPDTTYSYCVVQTIRPWSDNSGGLPIQIAYKKRQSDGLPMMYIRCSYDDLSGWNSWYEIYHSGNFSVKSIEDKIDDVISEFGDTSKLLYGEVAFEGATWGADYILASSEDSSGRFIAKEKYVRLSTLDDVANGIPTAHAVYKYIEDNCIKVVGGLSTPGRIVTVSTTGSITQSNYSISTSLSNSSTSVPTSSAVYAAIGNMSSIVSNYQKKIVEEIDGSMSSVGGHIQFDAIATKFIYEGLTRIAGSLKVVNHSSSETYKYRIINPSTFNSKLSSNFFVTISKFLKGYWWGTKASSSSLDIFGFGTAMTVQDSSYIGCGRIYTATGSYGNWAQDTLKNGMQDGILFFEVWFTV